MTDVARVIPNEPDLERPPPLEPLAPTNGHTKRAPKHDIAPHDREAEASLLGAAMLGRTDALDDITPGAFYVPAHGHIAHAIRTLRTAGQDVDAVTVTDHLRRVDLLDAVGGPAAVSAIQAACPASTAAPAYARIVTHHARTRAFIQAGAELAEVARTRGPDAAYELLAPLVEDQRAEVEAAHTPTPVDWEAFWVREHIAEDWLVHPVLPRGRQVALWARHKTGKSLLTIEIAAALASGRGCLSQPAENPIDVIYLDLEMTEDDLHERLTDLGYGPDDDLSRLHYYLLPSLPPLDQPEGGAVLVALATKHQAQAVVIDTMARVVTGDENDADTYRAFYRHTGRALKAMGVSVLRLDHGGKDPTKGQRGSSGKGDDVDVVWQLRPAESGLELIRDVARMSWVPERVTLLRGTDPLRHTITSGGLWPAGTAAITTEMQRLGITPKMPQREALRLFRDAGGEGKTDVLRAGWRYLRELAEREAQGWNPDAEEGEF